MTLKKFQSLLQKINPDLHIRKKARGDIAGIFHKNTYILRLNKGELSLKSHRTKQGMKRRGRYQVVRMLHRYGWIKPKHKKQLIWGIQK